MIAPQDFQGIFTAIITPFSNSKGSAGSIDTTALTKLVERQIEGGVNGIVVIGTTGEAVTLSEEEKKLAIQTVMKAASGRVPVVAGAGSNNTTAAVETSKTFADLGVDGLLHVAPYYNKPSQEGMLRHFEACASATPLPVIAYNVPGRTSSDILPATWAKLAELPTVIALKDATGDIQRGCEYVMASQDNAFVVSGDDFTALGHLAIGGRGMISVVSNILPKQTSNIWQAFLSGDLRQARALHQEMFPLITMLFSDSNPVPTKTALASLGLCEDAVRLPLYPCNPALREKISAWAKNRSDF